MMGTAAEIKTVPYFWSAMFGKTIRYAGGFIFYGWTLPPEQTDDILMA